MPTSAPSTQPAIMKPTEEPPAYTQIAKDHAIAQAELLKRQEELERKAAELDRREREIQSLNQPGGRKNNWPPLPGNFPVGPCFYQDFSVDIPVEFQKTVKIMYYLWMFHTVTLFVNIFGCLAWFCVDTGRGVDFGLAILWFLLFTPCSFVCWYRPLYGAFRFPAPCDTYISLVFAGVTAPSASLCSSLCTSVSLQFTFYKLQDLKVGGTVVGFLH
ncbi:hypothetical protein GDO81_002693 [Engystomops pustulosus]|uniref:Secretory carrier-associated membrane protein n=1 Tax=Engystomops pustulosus TaxID=76066 RepID=A0AAV7DN94_ENGPU|nr:hypothetical protein GDO81_002693 [Engystomops pustulosus]